MGKLFGSLTTIHGMLKADDYFYPLQDDYRHVFHAMEGRYIMLFQY